MLDYSHAYFILPVSLWLTIRNRNDIKQHLRQNHDNHWTGLLLFIFGISMFLFGWRLDYLCVSTISIIPLLSGLILFLYGRKVLKTVLFPVLYLLMLVPPPSGIIDQLTQPMQYGVSVVTEIILKLFNYPVSREGLLISIGKNNLFISQPCSGFRSLITMFALAIPYIYVIKGPLLKKSILLMSVIPFALIGNLIRVITLCLITYYLGEKAAMGFFHNFSGMLIFFIMIICLITLETMMEKKFK
jgi:exosortase